MLFADATLAHRVEAAECRLSLAVADAVGARGGDTFVAPIGGGAAVFTGESSPVNKVIGVGFDTLPAEAEWQAVEQEFARRRCAVRAEISTLADPLIHASLTRRGYILAEFENVLAFDLARDVGPGAAPGAGVSVVAVDVHDDRWVETVLHGFAQPDGSAPATETISQDAVRQVFRDFATSPGFAAYLGFVGDRVAGGGGMRVSDGVAQLCGAATLPAYRRRGVQAALLRRRLEDARRAGCGLAIVTTQPGSKSNHNAQRQGFEFLYPRTVLVKDMAL